MAASRGIELASGTIRPQDVRIGQIILECARDVFTGLNKRNTILGTILLDVPIIVSSAAAVRSDGHFSVEQVRQWAESILNNTSVDDTVDVYRAFHLARPWGDLDKDAPGWTEVHDRFDIGNPNVYDNIREDQVTLYNLFCAAADVDMISKEWSQYFQITLYEAYPFLARLSHGLEDLEEAVVTTFLYLLSRHPDGLIVKKAGREKAEQVRVMAERVFAKVSKSGTGGPLLINLDKLLRKDGNLLNPGTTADLVSGAILCELTSLLYP
jgi:triphosphoribosyl-dephospho-CoA synthase